MQDRLNGGLAAGRSGNCAVALKDLRPLLLKGHSSIEVLNVVAVCETRDSHPEQARPLFERIAKLQPGVWQAWNNLGGNYLALDHPALAVPAFRQAIKLNPEAVSAWFNLGLSLSKLGKSSEAFGAFDRAQRLRPADPQIQAAWLDTAGKLASEAAECVNRRQYEKAKQSLLQASRPLGGSASWNNLLGYSEYKLGNVKPAFEHLQRALQLDPANVDYLLDMGEFLGHYHADHEAQELFEMAAQRLPGSKRVQFGLAICYILEDRRIQATQLLEKLIDADPRFEPAYRALGECYEDAGDGKAMVALGKKLQAVDASDPVAWYLLGAGSLNESAQDQPLVASAIASLQHAVNLVPASARYHFMLAKAYEEEHADSKAIEELKETLRLSPNHPRAHYVLAQLYQRLHEGKLAQAQFAAHNKIKGKERNSQYRLLLTRAALQ
jgi:tetratricopeptide (TPR) repeat protein